jgi:NADH:ubiquinone oxidoreductase subunit E
MKMDKECEKILKKYHREEGSVISILQDLQNKYGHVPREAIYWFSERLNIPASNFFGVATFYSQFHLKPRGRHIVTICLGTACHVRGAVPVLYRLQDNLSLSIGEYTTADRQYTLESIACMGACGLAPVIKINKKVHGNVTPEVADEILDAHRGVKKR